MRWAIGLSARRSRIAQLAAENERLQRALRARLKEEEALRRVATEHAPGAVLALVTEEVCRHLEADTAATVRYGAPDRAIFVASWSAPDVDPSPFRVGSQIELAPQSVLAQVRQTAAPARVDSYENMPGSFIREVRARPTSDCRRADPRGQPPVGCVRRGLDDRPLPR